jgi:integrase
MAAAEPIRNKKQIRELILYFKGEDQIRNQTLVVIGLYTALRISDILKLCWDDVYNFDVCCLKKHIFLSEKKSGKPKIIAINKEAAKVLDKFAKKSAEKGKFVIENPETKKPISRVQAHRILKKAAKNLAFNIEISCHSLRKTFGYHSWKRGVPPSVLTELFNHSSYEVTKFYLGVTQDDLDEAYTGLTFWDDQQPSDQTD